MNIQMKTPEVSIPAELICDLPLPVFPEEAQGEALEIEQEIMALFYRYRGPLLRFAVSFGAPIPDAEEIVQEVFLALFRHLQLGRSRRNLAGWLFRVAHNLTLKRCHVNKRMAVIREQALNAADELDPKPNPEDEYSISQRQRQLLAVVEALPDIDRSCLRMRAEGLRYREIAKALGISLGSVSISLARSLGKLNRADRRYCDAGSNATPFRQRIADGR